MIRVLVVDDSAFSRQVITKILEGIPNVGVVDIARDGQEALRKTLQLRPDMITLDLEMPFMDGFTFLRFVMKQAPTPVIVVSAEEADENVFRALDAGAVDFVVKPTRRASTQLEEIEADLVEKVLAIPMLALFPGRPEKTPEYPRKRLQGPATFLKPELVGVASSTGGPTAIQTILKGLPSGFDVPLLIAQHMPAGFTRLFADRLNKFTSMVVQEVAGETPLHPGNIYIAPGGRHLMVERRDDQLYTRLCEREMDRKYSPSGNLLFASMAVESERPVMGVVLTGMGDDGKDGLRKIKEKGGIGIAESEETAVIFGMPQESIRAGLVDHVLPLNEIAGALSSLCRTDESR
jgi:two-component system chemotaxis response regulator CheB